MIKIFPIVEGHGDVRAVPVLLRRLFNELHQRYDLEILEPYRLSRAKIATDELIKPVKLGLARLEGASIQSIWVICDADDDCPAVLADRIRSRICDLLGSATLSVVVASKEYESWFLLDAAGFAGHPRVRTPINLPDNPEEIRDAKGAFKSAILSPGQSYSESVDQVKFTSLMSLNPTRKGRSWIKLEKEVRALASPGGL